MPALWAREYVAVMPQTLIRGTARLTLGARSCFFDDNGNEYCSQDGSGWNSWGRWVALSVLLFFIGLFIILAYVLMLGVPAPR